MSIAWKHIDGLDVVARNFVVPHFIGFLLAELNESVSADDNEGLPLAVMPMLTFGNPWFGDIDRDLTIIERMDELGEGSSVIYVHLEVNDYLFLGEVREIGGHELVLKGAFGYGHCSLHLACLRIDGFSTLVDDVNNLAEGGLVDYRTVE